MAGNRNQKSDEVLFRVAELFFRARNADQIAKEINEELHPVPLLTRQQVLPLLRKAKERQFIRLMPPADLSLADELTRAFNLPAKSVRVVAALDRESNEHVAAAAAEWAMDLIREVGAAGDQPVGLGLGPGRATLEFCRVLSEGMRSESKFPLLKLFAIAAGCPPRSPEYAPVSFFNLFPAHSVAARVGLFAPTLVRAVDFPRVQRDAGAREAFEDKSQVSLVVTSMGDFGDEHDLLRVFLRDVGVAIDRQTKANGWLGNVQYRPYTKSSPVREKNGEMRAVTLFELDELRELATKRHKHVLLIARKCGVCGAARSTALRALLEVPALRVFSELVMDAGTARELLRPS